MTDMITNSLFQKLIASLGADVTPSSPTTVEFVFDDDLPARITLHPNGREVVVDAFAFDASELDGDLQGAVMDTLLRLNSAGIRGRYFAVAVDPQGYIAATSRAPMAKLDGAGILELLGYVAEQARRVRTLVGSMAPPALTQSHTFIQPNE